MLLWVLAWIQVGGTKGVLRRGGGSRELPAPRPARAMASRGPDEGEASADFRIVGFHTTPSSVVVNAVWSAAAFSEPPFVEYFARTNLVCGAWESLGWVQADSGSTNVCVEIPDGLLPDPAARSAFFTARAEAALGPDDADDDCDGLSNAGEAQLGTNPHRRDTDGDGYPDNAEAVYATGGFASDGFVLPEFDLSSQTNLLDVTDAYAMYPAAFDVQLPFAVEIGGRPSTRAVVNFKGLAVFPGGGSTLTAQNYFLGDQPAQIYSGVSAVVSAYGYLFMPMRYTGSEIRIGTFFGTAGRWFVVEWRNMMDPSWYIDYELGMATFQLAVCEADPSTIHVRYVSLVGTLDGTGAIIGAHGLGGDPDLLLSNGDSGSVASGLVISYHFGTGTNPLNPDTDGDGLRDGWEAAHGMDPHVNNEQSSNPDFAPDADPDHDGLTNRRESELGTNPFLSDTDGDGMDDAWETGHGFDPLLAGDPDADTDLDGLTDGEECSLRTNPRARDSDGDGVEDAMEVAQNSDPADPEDGGRPASRVAVLLTFGDHSTSQSEKYLVTLTPVADSGPGGTPDTVSRISARFDGCVPQKVLLKPGWRYEVRLGHAHTNPAYTGTPKPDYDYTLSFTEKPANVLLDDPQGLFGVHNWDSGSFTAPQKVAFLSVLSSPQLTAPEVVGVNGDDDDGNGWTDWEDARAGSSEDDLVEVKVKVAEPTGVQGTVTVTPYVSPLSGTLWKDREKSDSVGASEVLPIPPSGIVERTYYLEGSGHSSVYRGEHLEVKVQCGSIVLATNHAFTVVERIAEPITTERFGGQIANPCCAVAGTAVSLKVDVLPHDFPDAEIKWRVASGGGSFAGGGTGRTVQFTASGGEGALSTVQVDMGDCPGSAPRLTVRTTTLHEVLIFPCVIEREDMDPPITASTLAMWLNEVNAVYRQVGLHFSLGAPITNIINNTWASDGLTDKLVGAQIRNILANTGGIEVYFIPGNGGVTEPVGSHTAYGIIIRHSANARSLAHEIGHACGWADIYATDSGGKIPDELYDRVSRNRMPDDWSGGGDVGGFYETDLRQYALIPRLLMYGRQSEVKADIPSGSVYGRASDGVLGNMNVGRGGFFMPSPVSQ